MMDVGIIMFVNQIFVVIYYYLFFKVNGVLIPLADPMQSLSMTHCVFSSHLVVLLLGFGYLTCFICNIKTGGAK